jgi:hypothetical protein
MLFQAFTRFEPREHPGGEGAVDDASSWGVCGLRQLKWHAGSSAAFGSEWRVGDVIGFALDMRAAGGAVLSVSVNGSFSAPNGWRSAASTRATCRLLCQATVDTR